MDSNSGFNSTTSKEAGGPFDERQIDSSPPQTETSASKTYRNASNDEG